MKKIFYILFACVLTTNAIYSQDKSNFDFVIVIDEAVVNSINNPKLLIRKENELLSSLDIQYHPGNLSLKTADYNLVANSDNDLYLKFDYYDYSSGSQKVYNYDIKIGKNWFEKSYIIFRLYNTDKKKYKKMFDPIEGTKYTYEIDYAGGSMLRVRKKK